MSEEDDGSETDDDLDDVHLRYIYGTTTLRFETSHQLTTFIPTIAAQSQGALPANVLVHILDSLL
jgi:hypothetical protein